MATDSAHLYRTSVDQLDRTRRLIEETERAHRTLAEALGFERIRANDVERGDVIGAATGDGWFVVTSVRKHVTDGPHEERITFGEMDGKTVHTFDSHDLVSRHLPNLDDEPF